VPADHSAHEPFLVARLVGDDLEPAERPQADELIRQCTECAALAAELRALAAATAALPRPRRTRDFRLSVDDAARLRGSRLPRLARIGQGLAGPRFGLLQPLGGAVLSMGVALVLVGTVTSPPGGGQGDARPAAGTAAAAASAQASAIAPPRAEVAAGATAAAGAPAPQGEAETERGSPAASAGAAASPQAGAPAAASGGPVAGPDDPTDAGTGSGPDSPFASPAIDMAGAPTSGAGVRATPGVQLDREGAGAASASGGARARVAPVDAAAQPQPGAPGLPVSAVGFLLVLLGLALLALRAAARRLGRGQGVP
jgi:hypothetical protein